MLSGNTEDAFISQSSQLISSLDRAQREKIVETLQTSVYIPSSHTATMKANLKMPWNMMREISRWLKTFNIDMASEKRTKQISKRWVGLGLQDENAPLTCKGSKIFFIQTI